MSQPKVATAKSTPHNERTGRCAAVNCTRPCSAPRDDRHITGWQTCACGHTRAVHDTEEKTT